MFTEVEEIAPDIFRLSTHIEDIAPPAGFTFNQFLIRGDEPFLFHTGMRGLFPLVSEAVNRIVPVTDLRWISFAHVEADECGAMNDFLAVAPNAQVVHGGLAVMVSLSDWPTVRPEPWATMRSWTSVGTACGSFHAPSPTTGERSVVRRDHRDAVRWRSLHPHRQDPRRDE
jgi:hypothetical protein